MSHHITRDVLELAVNINSYRGEVSSLIAVL